MAEALHTSGTLNGGHTGLTGTPTWEEDFTLDPTNNWTNYTTLVAGSTTLNQDRTASKVNQVRSLSTVGQVVYDANGNMTTAPVSTNWVSTNSQTYDAWNRVMTMFWEGGDYQYDGLHRRIWKFYVDSFGNHALDTYYNAAWQIVEEQFSNLPLEQYVWGLLGIDNLVLRDRSDSTGRLYAFSDYASVRAIANASGTVEERYDYNAYGSPLYMDANWGALTASAHYWQPLYATYLNDLESGFYQVRNRYLHPTLGRWLTRDPVGYQGGINLYAYCGNAPINQVDAWGMASFPAPAPLRPPCPCCVNDLHVNTSGSPEGKYGIGQYIKGSFGDYNFTGLGPFTDPNAPTGFPSPFDKITLWGSVFQVVADFTCVDLNTAQSCKFTQQLQATNSEGGKANPAIDDAKDAGWNLNALIGTNVGGLPGYSRQISDHQIAYIDWPFINELYLDGKGNGYKMNQFKITAYSGAGASCPHPKLEVNCLQEIKIVNKKAVINSISCSKAN